MLISSPAGDYIELRIDGYQFGKSSSAPKGGWDENWLIVVGRVKRGEESWAFRDPCLTTWEARELLTWLRAIPDAKNTSLVFTEPNLSFSTGTADPGESTLVVTLSGEAAPPSAPWDERWGNGVPMEFHVDHASLTAATDEWERHLVAYPLR